MGSCRSGALVDRTLQFYTKLYLQDDILTKVDRASMMHSLEVRAPFSTSRWSISSAAFRGAYKLRGGQTKYLLKKALEPSASERHSLSCQEGIRSADRGVVQVGCGWTPCTSTLQCSIRIAYRTVSTRIKGAIAMSEHFSGGRLRCPTF